MGERISDELDYEIEAQHQRRLERAFRRHPHVRVPRLHTELSARRVLVSEYVEVSRRTRSRGWATPRDRVGEIAFRFYAGLAWRADWAAIVAEHHSDRPAPTALVREDRAFFQRR